MADQRPMTAEPPLLDVVVAGLLRTAWWWRTELIIAAALVGGSVWLTQRLGVIASGLIVGSTGSLLTVLPWPSRLLGRLFASERGRRRWHRAIRQAALPALRDRPTEVLRSRPVPAGDLLTVAVPYGSAVSDLEAGADVVAAALHARDLRITRDPANARHASVLVLRRDPLGDGRPLSWPWADRERCSLWQPVPVALDETGRTVEVLLPERNLLLGGEPGAGKSAALSLLVAAAALDPTGSVWLLDGKRVELAIWQDIARAAVGPSVDEAIDVLRTVQAEMDVRYTELLDTRRRKVTEDAAMSLHVVVCDELAFYLHTGDRKAGVEFANLTRDLVARGRAAGVIVLAATQKPSVDVVPSALRDLFAFRWAMRCTTPQASDTILGQGWASQDANAATIDLAHRGVGYLLAEAAFPVRCKAHYLDDAALETVADRAAALRNREIGS